MKQLRTKLELIAWARRVLIEAMLAGISFRILSQGIGVSQAKLSQFTCFGAALSDDELKLVCEYMGANDPVADKITQEKYQEYYAPVARR